MCNLLILLGFIELPKCMQSQRGSVRRLLNAFGVFECAYVMAALNGASPYSFAIPRFSSFLMSTDQTEGSDDFFSILLYPLSSVCEQRSCALLSTSTRVRA